MDLSKKKTFHGHNTIMVIFVLDEFQILVHGEKS